MSGRTVELDLASDHKLARDLAAGGVFVPGAALEINEECELVLRGDGDEVRLRAIVVFANGAGIGLQLHNFDGALKERIAALASGARGRLEAGGAAVDPAKRNEASEGDSDAPSDVADDETPTSDADEVAPAEDDAGGDEETRKTAANVHERLRGLSLAQQLKLAHTGEVSERIVLERLYGKAVWEALLRNPRLTGPEVARIARMGSLPRPMMEIIVGNGGWLQIPEVRRALLTNPRLGTDHIIRILRLLPKHELKLAAAQSAYPHAVRDTAKRLIKEAGS